MDRLLTNKERNIYYHEGELDNQGLLKAQDAKTASYYETVIIPQKIKEAEKKLIEEIIKSIDGFHTEDDGQRILHLIYTDWQAIRKSRGIE
jgi:hypothetical protein